MSKGELYYITVESRSPAVRDLIIGRVTQLMGTEGLDVKCEELFKEDEKNDKLNDAMDVAVNPRSEVEET